MVDRQWLMKEIGDCTSAAYAAEVADEITIVDQFGGLDRWEYSWIGFRVNGIRWCWNPDDGWDDTDALNALLDHAITERDAARAEVEQLKTAALARTPAGTGLCYLHNGVIVLLGYPDENSNHNCDEMGCGSVSHVVERRRLSTDQMKRLGRGEAVGLSDCAALAEREEPNDG